MFEDCPKTLLEAARYFSDLSVCNEYMKRIKWPGGVVTCPKCGAKGQRIGEIATRHMLRCKDCRKQFSHKLGTIFEDSPIGLDKWFVAVWAIANCKNGISSHELGRTLGVTQKTAWFMLHRIRKAMEIADGGDFGGPAEADTTYIGGAAANMHAKEREKKIKGRGAVGKAIVHGVLQRGDGDGEISQVRAKVVSADDGLRLLPEIRKTVRKGAEIYTDEARAYGELCLTHVHKAVDHSVEYVRDTVHTNGIENFWSLLKRGLSGTYISVDVFHLFRYVAEQVFRFNERVATDAERFCLALQMVANKRLTWRLLTAQSDAGFMGLK